jgi:hypothetical protein
MSAGRWPAFHGVIIIQLISLLLLDIYILIPFIYSQCWAQFDDVYAFNDDVVACKHIVEYRGINQSGRNRVDGITMMYNSAKVRSSWIESRCQTNCSTCMIYPHIETIYISTFPRYTFRHIAYIYSC